MLASGFSSVLGRIHSLRYLSQLGSASSRLSLVSKPSRISVSVEVGKE